MQQARAMIDAAHGRTLTEREAKALLALYGVPVVDEAPGADAPRTRRARRRRSVIRSC